MSLPKRHIEIDPSTPFGEVTKFLSEGSGEVEVKSGPELFIVRRAVEDESSSEIGEPSVSAIDNLLKHAGRLSDDADSEDLKKGIEESRRLDLERQKSLHG